VSAGVMPIGMAIFGPLADVVKIQLLMIISGAALILVGIGIFYNKNFLKEGIKPIEEVV
jgi:DHA3 family macrolide efflux protein-like MFS transporter